MRASFNNITPCQLGAAPCEKHRAMFRTQPHSAAAASSYHTIRTTPAARNEREWAFGRTGATGGPPQRHQRPSQVEAPKRPDARSLGPCHSRRRSSRRRRAGGAARRSRCAPSARGGRRSACGDGSARGGRLLDARGRQRRGPRAGHGGGPGVGTAAGALAAAGGVKARGRHRAGACRRQPPRRQGRAARARRIVGALPGAVGPPCSAARRAAHGLPSRSARACGGC